MWLDPRRLERLVSGETSLRFEVSAGQDDGGKPWYLLRPAGVPSDHSFGIRSTHGWRRLQVAFEPGKFAGDLLGYMGSCDETGRVAFSAILKDCEQRGAKITLRVNDQAFQVGDDRIWEQPWSRVALTLSKGQVELGAEDGPSDLEIIGEWTCRFAAAVAATLPVGEEQGANEPFAEGLPEGAQTIVRINRYERDRRNRAAAIAIHGSACKACGLDMGQLYGEAATGFVEVHHIIPVSGLGEDYVIDPERDLVPLCPNCHAVAHRKQPPFSVLEIADMIRTRERD